MHSRFIERPADELAFIAQRIRGFMRALSPMYVSDHLLRFTVSGRSVAFLPELDYERQGERVLDSRHDAVVAPLVRLAAQHLA
ncbi:hypothetical protein [Sorangium sp. So ce388]|uniref:hypothetical protein n=1 Tax=Sorangium sp. So ce388 TaxID=3133309 RepID=UPI003F5B6699